MFLVCSMVVSGQRGRITRPNQHDLTLEVPAAHETGNPRDTGIPWCREKVHAKGGMHYAKKDARPVRKFADLLDIARNKFLSGFSRFPCHECSRDAQALARRCFLAGRDENGDECHWSISALPCAARRE